MAGMGGIIDLHTVFYDLCAKSWRTLRFMDFDF